MLEGLTEQRIQTLEAELLALVRAEASVGNVTLVKRLADVGWSAEQYWAVRQRLVDRGALEIGQGWGGSVRLADPGSMPAAGKLGGAVVFPVAKGQAADVLEIPLAGGGRILAVVQGCPNATDISNVRQLFLERYPEPKMGRGGSLASMDDDEVDAPTQGFRSDEPLESEVDLGESGDDEVCVFPPKLVPDRRAHLRERMEVFWRFTLGMEA